MFEACEMPFRSSCTECGTTLTHHDSDEDGTDGISDHPVKSVNQECRDDDSDAAQGIGQDVQKDLKIEMNFIFFIISLRFSF